MAPTLSFIYSRGTDTAYSGTGGQDADWYVVDVSQDKKIYTGGGIIGTLPTPYTYGGNRDATVRPAVGTYVVPQIYIEDPDDFTADPIKGTMWHVPTASGNPNTNRYVFGVYIDGEITSDLYIEYWDDNTFSSTDLPVLSGTVSYPQSMINVIKTTEASPPVSWNGSSTDAAYIAGFSNKLGLMDSVDSIPWGNKAVYFNIYTRIPSDASLFHNEPIEAYRYLYSD